MFIYSSFGKERGTIVFEKFLQKMNNRMDCLYPQDGSRPRFQKWILTGLLCVFSLTMAVVNLSGGHWLVAIGMIGYFILGFLSWLALGSEKYATLGNLGIEIASVAAFLFTLVFGSDNPTTLLWLGVIPTLAMMFLGLTSALAFLGAAFAAMVILYLTPIHTLLGLVFHPVLDEWFMVLEFFLFIAVSATLEFLRRMTSLKLEESRQEILRLSYFDDLTQIFNRRSFDNALNELWNGPFRTNRQVSLMMIDIDNFKLYNDNFGHLQGDKILTRIALTISSVVGGGKYTLARYGGEEFVVLLPDVGNEEATEIAESVKEAVSGLGLVYFDSSESASRVLSVSIGVATETLSSLDNPETLIRIADENLYRAKRNGKNSVWSASNHLPNS